MSFCQSVHLLIWRSVYSFTCLSVCPSVRLAPFDGTTKTAKTPIETFLDAPTHLYKRACLSVGKLVGCLIYLPICIFFLSIFLSFFLSFFLSLFLSFFLSFFLSIKSTMQKRACVNQFLKSIEYAKKDNSILTLILPGSEIKWNYRGGGLIRPPPLVFGLWAQ